MGALLSGKSECGAGVELALCGPGTALKPAGCACVVVPARAACCSAAPRRQLCTGEKGIVPEGREGAGRPYHFKVCVELPCMGVGGVGRLCGYLQDKAGPTTALEHWLVEAMCFSMQAP